MNNLEMKIRELSEKVVGLEKTEVSTVIGEVVSILDSLNKSLQLNKKDEAVGRINKYYIDRINQIISGKLQSPFDELSNLFVMHIIPLESFENENINHTFDLAKIKQVSTLKPIYSGNGWSSERNADGLLSYNKISYKQLYRNGVLEVVDKGLLYNGRLHSGTFEKKIIADIKESFQILNSLESFGEILIRIKFIGLKNLTMHVDPERFWDSEKTREGDVLTLPDVFIENEQEITNQMKIAFNALWNMFGYDRSFSYDENGIFIN
ncbi:hypothetical protein [Peribacillus loiseleuriae]|uniref:hypothetical protein n=1 Tax=Peribacillus loiseleuriae TaxID=1679170 RepID=UPI003CFDE8C1